MSHDILPFPANREVIIDAGYLAARRHVIHALIEVDVSLARQRVKNTTGKDGRPISFTAFIVASLAKAITTQPTVQAYLDLRRRLIVFHDVDVVTLIEPEPGAAAIPHIIRAADKKSVIEISDEIRSVQATPGSSHQSSGLVALAPRVPRFARLLFVRALKVNPHWFKRVEGTVILTSVGMFGKHGGWGIGFLQAHTLGLTVGGIEKKAVVHDNALSVGECLNLTISFDHDIVDGAPAARFAQTLVQFIENATVVDF